MNLNVILYYTVLIRWERMAAAGEARGGKGGEGETDGEEREGRGGEGLQ